MKKIACAGPIFALLVVVGATSASALPPVVADAHNPVPSCVTPSRLMTYLRSRNPALDERLADIASEYHRQGQAAGIRWDYAFFQMIVETASLSYRRADGTPGRVAPHQYNFAALGVRDEGAPGKRFANLTDGVQAHVRLVSQHARQRAGFADLARTWAPDDPRYATNIESVARRFFERACQHPGREPEVASLAIRAPVRPVVPVQASFPAQPPAPIAPTGALPPAPAIEPEPTTGEHLARQAANRARDHGASTRAGLGAYATRPAPSLAAPQLAQTPHSATASQGSDDDTKASGDGMKTTPLRVVALTPGPRPEPPKRTVDPADEAVRTLVSGRTILLDTPVGTQIPILFREDGSMRGKAGDLASYLGADIDDGKWWVSQGRLCQKFKVWFDKETQCLTLRQAGQIVHWSSDTGKSGTARFGPRT